MDRLIQKVVEGFGNIAGKILDIAEEDREGLMIVEKILFIGLAVVVIFLFAI